MASCYLHVPFCKDICAYCDFFRCRYHATLSKKWLAVIQREIQEKLSHSDLTTMYIGGGTPSALSVEELNTLLVTLDPYVQHVKEYTMEANIESLSEEKLKSMKEHGINRISLGIQTLQDELIHKIKRHHDRNMVLHCIQHIHEAGIHNISVDLIYGLPDQTMKQWIQDLEFIVHLDIAHVSLYSLTIEEHSLFGRMHVKAMDEDLESDMFEYAIRFLEEHGFEHYEISNFAKEGKRSLHNQVYWHYDDFIGIGCGASGKQDHKRYDNTKNLEVYFQKGACAQYTALSKEDEMFEMLMMSLRMKEGLSLSHFEECFHVSFVEVYHDTLYEQIEKGLLKMENDHVTATHQGMLLLNDVLEEFL